VSQISQGYNKMYIIGPTENKHVILE